ncbi:E3 ubiquitin-protein ligase CCNB1IP1-like [Melanaphis sacchari]|uniref:E3 ubiquitin-protein ligase CCNB1IP1-like n=1 Tax=Melanaphis sacchari TaxID=742174 RepID=UPI000DC150E7|nr:E3 ubiquitin-protein ligase CCNB1IP1-like [Melanaphis sacchari]
MSEINLICNYKKCRKALNTFAWVTSCSHIFCNNDGSRTFNREKKCPCCNEVLNRRLDIVQVNLNPDESFKSMILCGLRPEVVMDISLRAVSFWNYQMTQEKIIQTSDMKKLQAKFEQVKINIETMEYQFQKHILIETKTALRDAELQRQKTQEIEEKLIEKNRILHKVQSKYESLKLQLISNTIKSTKTEQIPMAQLQPKAFEGQTEFVFAPNFD